MGVTRIQSTPNFPKNVHFLPPWYAHRRVKETPTQGFSWEYCEISKNTYFEEHLRPAAFENFESIKIQWSNGLQTVKVCSAGTDVYFKIPVFLFFFFRVWLIFFYLCANTKLLLKDYLWLSIPHLLTPCTYDEINILLKIFKSKKNSSAKIAFIIRPWKHWAISALVTQISVTTTHKENWHEKLNSVKQYFPRNPK